MSIRGFKLNLEIKSRLFVSLFLPIWCEIFIYQEIKVVAHKKCHLFEKWLMMPMLVELKSPCMWLLHRKQFNYYITEFRITSFFIILSFLIFFQMPQDLIKLITQPALKNLYILLILVSICAMYLNFHKKIKVNNVNT